MQRLALLHLSPFTTLQTRLTFPQPLGYMVSYGQKETTAACYHSEAGRDDRKNIRKRERQVRTVRKIMCSNAWEGCLLEKKAPSTWPEKASKGGRPGPRVNKAKRQASPCACHQEGGERGKAVRALERATLCVD